MAKSCFELIGYGKNGDSLFRMALVSYESR